MTQILTNATVKQVLLANPRWHLRYNVYYYGDMCVCSHHCCAYTFLQLPFYIACLQ